MATRRKKAEDTANDIPLATDAKAHKKTKIKIVESGAWPKIKQGTHLTVKTFEDGKTELVWDDEALLNEVRAAIKSVEIKPTVKAKQARLKKVKEIK